MVLALGTYSSEVEMAYLPPVQSDKVATEVTAAREFNLVSHIATSDVSVAGYQYIDFIVEVQAIPIGTTDDMEIIVEGSDQASPGVSQYFTVNIENDTGTPGLYTSETFKLSVVGILVKQYHVSVPVRGITMRALVKGVGADFAGTSYKVTALRRVA